MTAETAYEPPRGANIPHSQFNPKDKVKTNRDIIRMWAHNGYEWSNSNHNVPRKSLRCENVGVELRWHNVLIAEHFEHHTVVYANTERTVHDIVVAVTDVLLNEANYTKLGSYKPPTIDEALASIFGDTA